MCEEQQFDFGDFNLKFFELTPPRPTQGAPTSVKCVAPLPGRVTLNHKKLSSRVQDIAKRIANNDSLIQQLHNLEKERKGLQQQLKDFQSSAKDISKLYEAEKLERIQLQSLTSELRKRCETLTADLASITLANDQLGYKLEETNHLPVDYNDLSTCYMRLFSKLDKDQALHWHDMAIAEKLRKYCVENSLFVPEKRSPKKRKPKIKKPEIGIQCDLWSNAPAAPNHQMQKEVRSQGTQYINVEYRSQGTQHIRTTTTTRSTCTSSFIKKRDIGTCFPEQRTLPAIDDMLREMLRWDIKPVSPIPTNIIAEQLATTKKSTGTCTLICNIQKTIDYIGGGGTHQLLANVKRSNSRPPSRNIADRIKNEVLSPPSVSPIMLPFEPNVEGRVPQLPSSLNTLNFTTFDDLWQVFGQMLFGLLKNRNSDELNSIRPLGGTGGNPINQHEFQSWLRSMYEEISKQNTDAQDLQRNNAELQEFTNNTSGNKADEPAHQTIGTSPIRFVGSIQDVDSSFNTNEEFSCSYPAGAYSTAILPADLLNFDGEKFSKIYIPAKTQRDDKYQRKKKKKYNKYSDTVVNEILDLFPPLECSSDKKLKITKLLKKQNTTDAKNVHLQKKATFADKPYVKSKSPPISSENAVDFLTQLGSSVNNISNITLLHKITVDNNNTISPLTENETTELQNTEVNHKPARKLKYSLFGSDTDDESSKTYSERDEGINLKTNDKKTREEGFTENSIKTEGCFIERHALKEETSYVTKNTNCEAFLSFQNEKKTLELCKDDTVCGMVSELNFSIENVVNNVNDTYENNLIIDEYYDAGSSQEVSDCINKINGKSTNEGVSVVSEANTEISCHLERQLKLNERSAATTLHYNSTIPPISDNIDETVNPNTAILPLIDTSALNDILPPTNYTVEDLMQSDATFDSNNFEYNKTHKNNKSVVSSVLNSPSNKRGSKRKIDICGRVHTSLVCKRSARLQAKRFPNETTELTIQGKYTPINHFCEEQATQCKQFHTEEKNNLSKGLFKQLNRKVNFNYSGNVKQITPKQFEKDCLSFQEDYQDRITIPKVPVTQQQLEQHLKQYTTTNDLSYFSINNTSSSSNKDFQNKIEAVTQEIQSIQDFESPASPSIEENNSVESNGSSTKEIPLEVDVTYYSFANTSILQHLCKNYNNETHKLFSAPKMQISKSEQKQIIMLKLKIQEFLTTTTNESELDLASFMLVQQLQELTKNNITQIASVIVEEMQNVPRPETELGCKISEIPPKCLGKLHRKISYVMRRLQLLETQFSTELMGAIESKIFNFKNAEEFSLSSILNLTQLYLLTISNQLPQMEANPARTFIYKCLYFHKLRAIPMIYEVLCCFPTTLPHREDRSYDHSDALVTVIQHLLMCTKYDMDKEDLRTKELLSKLRFEYHFEAFKPERQEVLNNLYQKIDDGKLNNVSYALALLCKRLPQSKVESEILQAKLLPLANKFYTIGLNSTSHDAQIGCLLESISMIVKPFALDTDISIYSKMFARFLNAFDRQTIQEAAVQAILRMQRYGCSNCYNELIYFKPSYELQPITRAMLQTFVYRKPAVYWKKLHTESTIVTV